MIIPPNTRPRALIIVDVQPAFLNPRNAQVVDRIVELVLTTQYDVFVEATFSCREGSIWDLQQGWICPQGAATVTDIRVAAALRPHNPIRVHKSTKSVFGGEPTLAHTLAKLGIQEIHVVGLDTNDCVLATAFDAFDSGFVTYVIEECTESSASQRAHLDGLRVLREQNMTDQSRIDVVSDSDPRPTPRPANPTSRLTSALPDRRLRPIAPHQRHRTRARTARRLGL